MHLPLPENNKTKYLSERMKKPFEARFNFSASKAILIILLCVFFIIISSQISNHLSSDIIII